MPLKWMPKTRVSPDGATETPVANALAKRKVMTMTYLGGEQSMRCPLTVLSAFIFLCSTSNAADWPQWGGSPQRNNTPQATGLPVEWNVGEFDYRTGAWDPSEARNIRWVARLGSTSYGTPVVAGGRIYCATNNGAGYVRRYPSDVDLGVLLCFGQRDGRFGWQLSREKLTRNGEIDSELDWPDQGICCAPLVESDRLWIVTNRAEVVCVDTNGFFDGANDGPYTDEPSKDRSEADIVWIYDMMAELGIRQHNMAACSVTAAGDLLLLGTSNGRDDMADEMEAPEAPSFIALDKRTGKLVWADASPGANVLHGQWASPAYGELGGVPQAIFPGGDGWVYSFRAERTDSGKPELLWKFDLNPKDAPWEAGGSGERNNIIATPVIYDGRVYLAGGQDPEYGEGPAILWCIDPTKRGDVSPQLVVDAGGKPVPPRREKAIDEGAGEKLQDNPNSAAVFGYAGHDANGDGEFDFEETMHRTLGMVAVKDDLLVIGDLAGLVHCLDAKSGKVHWTYDMLAAMWGSPLVADGKIYIGDEDGDVVVFELSAKRNLLAENNMGSSVYSAPVVADDVLFISTRNRLFAIAAEEE